MFKTLIITESSNERLCDYIDKCFVLAQSPEMDSALPAFSLSENIKKGAYA